MTIFSESVVSRFWSKVDVLGENDCWEWLDVLNGNGYGNFWIDNKIWSAHHYSYEINVGPIGNLQVCHSCDNKSCVNPNHLWLGTQADNIMDRDEKGHCVTPNSRALNQEQINEVREKYATGNYTQNQLAIIYNIGGATISRIIQYKGAYENVS